MPEIVCNASSALGHIYSEIRNSFLSSCSLCGQCLEACSVFPMTSCGHEDPSDVQQKIVDFLLGKPSDIAEEMAYACSGCGKCIEACPMDLNPCLLREILKEELICTGLREPAKPLEIDGQVIDLQQLLGALQIKPSQKPWQTTLPAKPVRTKTLLFLGCAVRYQPDKGLALVKLLEMAGIDCFAIEGGQLCCGGKFVRNGNIRQAGINSDRLIAFFDEIGPEKVVFSCSSCYKRVGEVLEVLEKKPYEIGHAATFLFENRHRIKFNHRIEKTITIHDPCDLRMKPEDTDSVRKLLGKIPGITIKEMPHHQENALCCGIGSHDKNDIPRALRTRVLEEAKGTNAHIFTTICTGCHNHFCRAQNEYPFAIMHYHTLLAAAAGFSVEDKMKKYLQFDTIDSITEDAAAFVEASPYSRKTFNKALPLFFRQAKP